MEMQEFILERTKTVNKINGCKCLFGTTVVDQGGQLLTCQQTRKRYNAAACLDDAKHDFEDFYRVTHHDNNAVTA